MASGTEGASPYKTKVLFLPKTKKVDKTETTASEQALNSTATTQNSDVTKPGMIQKAKTGQQRGGTKCKHMIVGNQWSDWKPTGVQDSDAIRQILKEALEDGQSSMEVLHQKVQELIESKQKDTYMIKQLQQKTEELMILLKAEREKHSATETKKNKEMIGKEKQITELQKEKEGLKEETDKFQSKVGSLKTSNQKYLEMIEQLKKKTEELSMLLQEERERNEKHRTTQTHTEMVGKEAESLITRSAQCHVSKEVWSAEKENELLSLRQQTKSHEDYVFALLKAKREKEDEISRLKKKVEQLEGKAKQ